MNHHAESENYRLGNRHSRWVKQPDINRLPDEDLAAIAANAIECLTTIPTETIKVSARKGWLHLEGTVAWRDQRSTLEQVTRNLPGVHGVTDSIAVQSFPVQPHF